MAKSGRQALSADTICQKGNRPRYAAKRLNLGIKTA